MSISPNHQSLISDILPTKGCIGKALINDQTLLLRGWVGGINTGMVDDFKLMIGDATITDFQLTKGLPSIDVENLFPHLDNSANLRFQIILNIPAEKSLEYGDKLVSLTPLFNGKPGVTLFNIIAPSLPFPRREDLLAIGDDSAEDDGASFKASGCAFLQHFVQYAQLQPTASILDIGCGIGRIAYALAYYLDENAHYIGIDIVEKWINWNQQTITPKFPNFQFDFANIYNNIYNPTSPLTAKDFVFPYPNNNFDFIFLASVFTHIWAQEVRNYLQEISRMLKPGGKCLATFFLLNDHSLSAIKQGQTSLSFPHQAENCYYAKDDIPEYAVAYAESLILKWLDELGLTIEGKYYGWWCEQSTANCYQDLIIFSKSHH